MSRKLRSVRKARLTKRGRFVNLHLGSLVHVRLCELDAIEFRPSSNGVLEVGCQLSRNARPRLSRGGFAPVVSLT